MAKFQISSFYKVPELRTRLLFTIFALLFFRFGSVVPIPGINVQAIQSYFASLSASSAGSAARSFTDYLDFFAGGAFKNFSIFMLGVMPYITASIIMQLVVMVIPSLRAMSQREGGRRKVQSYTRYLTLIVCILQSFAVSTYAGQIPSAIQASFIGFPFYVTSTITVTAGSMILLWIGEQITARGVGNGVSLIIFAGIVARLPGAIFILIKSVRNGGVSPILLLVTLAIYIGVIILIVYEENGVRRIPVYYAKRIVGNKVYGAQSSYIPLKINPSGVIPVIFASSLLTFPVQIFSLLGAKGSFFSKISTLLRPNGPLYLVMYSLLILLFAYFYTQVTFNPLTVAKQIRENGGTIPGIDSRGSGSLELYLVRTLNRVFLPGALFLVAIALVPSLVMIFLNFPSQVAYLMGGTSLLIMVGVELDTQRQMEGLVKNYSHKVGIGKKLRVSSSSSIRGRNL